MKNNKVEGPKIKLKVYCTGCDYLKYQPRAVCGDDPTCTKLNIFLEEEHNSGRYLPLARSDCPFKREKLKEFFLAQITPENNGATILKLINGEKK